MLDHARHVVTYSAIFIAGVLLGGYLFSRTQPRSLLVFHRCEETCLRANELAGLLASVGVQRVPGVIPNVIRETDKTIAFESPVKLAPVHYLVIPKKDIKNIGELGRADQEYLVDAYAVMQDLIREKGLINYQIFTNGPMIQHVTYLHFRVMAR